MWNWFKAISTMSTSILTTILVSIEIQVGNGFFIRGCPYFLDIVVFARQEEMASFSLKIILKREKEIGGGTLALGWKRLDSRCLSKWGLSGHLEAYHRVIPHLWNLNRRICWNTMWICTIKRILMVYKNPRGSCMRECYWRVFIDQAVR